ncbi:hypothetical protein N9904_01275 [Akkermansiaceae bacterium]|nr:hypothetical protein [Akkermansiaceae bacterium]MDB4326116.1 hypothetical protein [bacterium]MDB4328138.1 hypothetical protein [Akkermansiaceae bacterium]MDB4417283.1 hypothetical protein [Akkermansiaceae bacterium]MDB4699939.1 hypothetical protein [Akkermansiaceae bacterium]
MSDVIFVFMGVFGFGVLGVLYFRLFSAANQPPFSPIRSGPKAASKPSRQKQIPSSRQEGEGKERKKDLERFHDADSFSMYL